MPLTYHPLEETDADYAALVEFANTESDLPRTVEEIRAMDSRRKPGEFIRREFVCEGERRIGTASCAQQTMSEAVGGYHINIALLPECRDVGFERPIFEHLIQVSKSAGGLVATAYLRDERKGRVEVLKELGFECIMRDPMSQVDLGAFDPSPFEPKLRDVESQGIVLRAISELEAVGVDWVPSAHELAFELLQDVPLPDTPRQMPLEEFRDWVKNTPFWFPDGWFVALDGERWVGQSQLSPYTANSDFAMTGLTGVVRSHRRRGIATALKVTALRRAKELGVRFVRTGNEEHNPMLQLNLRLGFRELYAMLAYRKKL